MTIGDRIRIARERLGLTQSDVARELKVKPQTVQQWESGQTSPRPKRIHKLAEVLKVSDVWLLTGQGPMRADAPRKAPAESMLAYLEGRVSPRSEQALRSIQKKAAEGKLTEEDLEALEVMAERLAAKHEEKPEGEKRD